MLDFPDISKMSPILLIPVLVLVTSFLGSEISRKFTAPAPAADGQNPANNSVLRFGMPIFSTFLTFSFFAALGLYWAYRSILSAVKQIIVVKMYPLPTFTKEEIMNSFNYTVNNNSNVVTFSWTSNAYGNVDKITFKEINRNEIFITTKLWNDDQRAVSTPSFWGQDVLARPNSPIAERETEPC